MKPIDAATLALHVNTHATPNGPARATITAFLDAVLADPEAMERLKKAPEFPLVHSLTIREIIDAIKQEVSR